LWIEDCASRWRLPAERNSRPRRSCTRLQRTKATGNRSCANVREHALNQVLFESMKPACVTDSVKKPLSLCAKEERDIEGNQNAFEGAESALERPDSVPYLLKVLRQLILYVETKPALMDGSASFIRDFLRTFLIQTQAASVQDSWTGGNNLREPLWFASAGSASGNGMLSPAAASAAHLEIEAMDAAEDFMVEEGSSGLGSGSAVPEADGAEEASRGSARVTLVRAPLSLSALSSSAAASSRYQKASRETKSYVLGNRPTTISDLPDDTLRRIFTYMNGPQLGRVRGVCKKWCKFASDENLWRKLCLENWRALETDAYLWRLLLDYHLSQEAQASNREPLVSEDSRWRFMYPIVRYVPKWTCRLQKTGRFVCRLVAHQIGGPLTDEESIPPVVVVERRFNLNHLNEFVLPDAAVFYFEPEREEDRDGYQNFIEYLIQRHRAGLALDEERRIIFIPPCAYSQNVLHYNGEALLGVVQHSYPPLAG